jgi:hypothetical protein
MPLGRATRLSWQTVRSPRTRRSNDRRVRKCQIVHRPSSRDHPAGRTTSSSPVSWWLPASCSPSLRSASAGTLAELLPDRRTAARAPDPGASSPRLHGGRFAGTELRRGPARRARIQGIRQDTSCRPAEGVPGEDHRSGAEGDRGISASQTGFSFSEAYYEEKAPPAAGVGP